MHKKRADNVASPPPFLTLPTRGRESRHCGCEFGRGLKTDELLKFTMQPPEKVLWGEAASPVGRLVVGRTEDGEVCRLGFLCGRAAGEVVAAWRAAWPRTEFVAGGEVEGWEAAPRLLVGTAFQHAVWRAMAAIPAGQVKSYGEIARRIGRPSAARAVGAACGANPVPYLVPCHRVVAAGGGLGGFSGGVGVKEMLLRGEGDNNPKLTEKSEFKGLT